MILTQSSDSKSGVASLFLHMATVSLSALWSLRILLELLSSLALLFYRIDLQDSITTPLAYSTPQLVKMLLKATFGNGYKGDRQRQQE